MTEWDVREMELEEPSQDMNDEALVWNAALDAALAVMMAEEMSLAKEGRGAEGPQDKTELLAMAVAVYNARGKVEGLRKKP